VDGAVKGLGMSTASRPPSISAASATEPPERGRTYLLTWHKAGSQWVRDLLTHHLAVHRSGTTPADVTFECVRPDGSPLADWPVAPPGTFVGPVYLASPDDWSAQRRPGDRAVVVLRDPRDIVVSLMYSLMASHRSSHPADRVRTALLALPASQRLMVACLAFARVRGFAAWATRGWGPHGDMFITSYERLVADTLGELSAAYRFLDWPIPAAEVRQIVEERSFETRSGRPRGVEDCCSHYRKGAPGDWRTHFDRLTGFMFDLRMNGELQRSGYEPDPRWYEQLPESPLHQLDLARWQDPRRAIELEAEMARLREENQMLRAELAQQRAA